MINRKDNWPTHLSNYLHIIRDKKFKWGKHDCIMHAVNCIRAITGFDLARGKRNRYKTKKEAEILIKEEFSGDLDTGWTEIFGGKREDVKKAHRGDVTRVTYKGEKAYGIVDDTGRFSAMISPKDGLIRMPLDRIEVYWRVG